MPLTSTIAHYHFTEVLYESNNSLVYRGRRTSDNQPVILKVLNYAYPSPEKIVQFKREYELTRSLNLSALSTPAAQALTGVVEVYGLETEQQRWVMVLEDFGGESLAQLQLAGRMPLTDFLKLAVQITDILGQVHQQHIIHKDINPSNIILNPQTGQIKLVDFGISTRLSRENSTFRNPHILEGTLAYMSPEQTGRMNRAMDYRTDFYSLGVTFYELITGRLPFVADDALELVHSHIAKQPIPPHELKADIPQIVSAIVLKLMAKNAEDRYQSSAGLRADLEKCLQQSQGEATERIEPFPLGQYDVSDRFQLPQKLYGREREIAALLAAFERVSQGACELMLVSGYAGIGKSALVQEVYGPLTQRGGYFISGRFDQLQRNIPYSALLQAFRSLIRQLLTENEAEIAAWREKLLAALGPNGQVIIEVIPEVELIIGSQPNIPVLAPTEAQNRFNLVFQNFIKVFIKREHPLVIFLDDLQWADSASLKLIEILMTISENRYLFLIGAYRDNEVSAGQPLLLTLAEIKQAGAPMHQLSLLPLALPDVTQLITDTLSCTVDRAKPLAELVQSKTAGNPFFMGEFLKSLYTEKLLEFVPFAGQPGSGGWQWNLDQIQARGITDNVVELMAGKVQQLPEETQQVLRLAACIGNQFDLEILALMYEKSLEETATDLWPAMTEGQVIPLSDTYKLVEMINPRADELASAGQREASPWDFVDSRWADDGPLTIEYKFAHDRVQQAVYSLIPEADKQAIHWRGGQLLLHHTPLDQREQRIFDIVNHLNLGSRLNKMQAEQDEVAALNLLSGRKAKASAAYEPAFNYLRAGVELLNSPVAPSSNQAGDSWQRQYDLTLGLYVEAAEAAYLSGNFEAMERLAETVLQHARGLLDKAKVYEVKIPAYVTQNRLQDALKTGREALELLKIKLPEQPSQADVRLGLQEIKSALAGKQIEHLIDLPEMTDPAMLATMRILSSVSTSAYQVLPELFPLITFKLIDLSVKHGNAPISTYAYATYGFLLCAMVGDIESGYRFGKLALLLLNKLNARQFKAKTHMATYSFIMHWKEHVRETLSPLLEGYQSGLETGDLEFAAYTANRYCVHSFFIGKELAGLEQEMAAYSEVHIRLRQKSSLQYLQIYQQAALSLMDLTEDPRRLSGEIYDEEKMLPLHLATNNLTALYQVYFSKMMLSYLFGDYGQAFENANLAEKYEGAARGFLNNALFTFYDSLTRLAVFPDSSPSEQEHLLKKVATNQEKMQKWGQHAPMNHLHKFYLVEAERARILGNTKEAREYYDQAIDLAQEHGYVNEEALANELATRFYLTRGQERLAHHYLRDTLYAYQRWGALAKVRDLEKQYSQFLLPSEVSPLPSSFTISTTSKQSASSVLDLTSVIKASQVISGEIVLDKLLDTLMKLVIENAGAERGYLILEKNGTWSIEATGAVSQGDLAVIQSVPLAMMAHSQTPVLPTSLINYVVHTQESVVLDNAAEVGQFTRDPYITTNRPRSVLCAPLLNHGRLTGLLYLENNLITGAFTSERLEVLNVLSSQAAISIENAELYARLEDLVEARTTELQNTYQNLKTLNDRLQAELNLAHRIQQSLLPPARPAWPNLEIVCYSAPAREVGGDLYVYHAFNSSTALESSSGRYAIAVGDVSGKGMPAALLMAVSLAWFQSIVRLGLRPGEFLAYLDNALVPYTRTTRQNCALVYLEITFHDSSNQGVLQVANAGCVMPIVRRVDGRVEWIDVGGIPLGVGLGATSGYQEVALSLSKGDLVILVSDGVIEANNASGEMFSFDRLEQAIRSGPQTSAQAMLDHLRQTGLAFAGETEPHDDMTLVVVQM